MGKDASWMRDALASGGLDLGNPSSMYFGGADPRQATALCQALAHRLKSYEVSVVVVDDRPESQILGHLVAEALGASWTRLLPSTDKLRLSGRLTEHDRCAYVTDVLRADAHAAAVLAAVGSSNAELVAIAAFAAHGQFPINDPIPLVLLLEEATGINSM